MNARTAVQTWVRERRPPGFLRRRDPFIQGLGLALRFLKFSLFEGLNYAPLERSLIESKASVMVSRVALSNILKALVLSV